MDFQKRIQEIRTLHAKLQKNLDAASKAELKLRAKVQALRDICKPACIKSAQEYNQSERLNIVEQSVQISFSADCTTIGLHVHLRYKGGHEPDEEMNLNEVREIGRKLGATIDRELRAANIPIAFGSLSVPTDYYMK